MTDAAFAPQAALKYEAEVGEEGRVEVNVPFSVGARVTVFAIKEPVYGPSDPMLAAQSSLGFWDNPLDDDQWNEA